MKSTLPKRSSRQALTLPEGWEILDLGDALAGRENKPPWIIKDLLLADTATQVSAHPHSMKSLAWLVDLRQNSQSRSQMVFLETTATQILSYGDLDRHRR